MKSIAQCALAPFLAAIFMAPLAIAQPGPPGQDDQGGGRRGPPPEAFEACTGKADGDACSFSGRRGDAEGSCVVPRSGDEALVCAPADHENRTRQEREGG